MNIVVCKACGWEGPISHLEYDGVCPECYSDGKMFIEAAYDNNDNEDEDEEETR